MHLTMTFMVAAPPVKVVNLCILSFRQKSPLFEISAIMEKNELLHCYSQEKFSGSFRNSLTRKEKQNRNLILPVFFLLSHHLILMESFDYVYI